jgi:hypothetical protein
LKAEREAVGDERGGKILMEELEAEIGDLKEIVRSKEEAMENIEGELMASRDDFEAKEKRLREEWRRDMENVRER